MDAPSRRLKLSELAEQFDLQFRGDGETLIGGVGTLSDATGSQLSFLSNPAYRAQLATTKAAAVLVSADDAEHCPVSVLIADDPYVSYAKIATRFDPRRTLSPGIHPSASIDPEAVLGNNIHVGANAVIGPGCKIADEVEIGPGCVLTADCILGTACCLKANVTLCDGVVIGKRSIVHPGAVIGADGFGLAFDQDHWVKIPQLGTVIIGDDCEIGANSTIDRGAIGDTVLEDDVRLDNQIQIGHNVHIGAHTAMAGRVGISGSTQIGKYCMFAGSSGSVGHISIADRTTVNFCDWNRSVAHLRKLEKLARRVLKLEKSTRETEQND